MITEISFKNFKNYIFTSIKIGIILGIMLGVMLLSSALFSSATICIGSVTFTGIKAGIAYLFISPLLLTLITIFYGLLSYLPVKFIKLIITRKSIYDIDN